MRNTLIKLFGLNYRFIFFGKSITFTRSANIIYPSILLLGLSCELYDRQTNLFTMILMFLMFFEFIMVLFFGFIYFWMFPIKYDETKYLDDVQKFGYSLKNNTIIDLKDINPTNKLWIFFVNPIITIIFLGLVRCPGVSGSAP